MSEEKVIKQSQVVYSTLCEMLDEHGWHYQKDEENMSIDCGVQGEDLPMPIRIIVDVKRQLITLVSQIPFIVDENRRKVMAVAVSKANYGLSDGSFDYDYHKGILCFRITSSYRDSLIGKDLFEYMLMCASFTVDAYNDKFLMVTKSDMSVDEILQFIK